MGCVEVPACSHPVIAAATETAATAIGVRSFRRARRRASLCKNVMVSAPSWCEELVPVALTVGATVGGEGNTRGGIQADTLGDDGGLHDTAGGNRGSHRMLARDRQCETPMHGEGISHERQPARELVLEGHAFPTPQPLAKSGAASIGGA